MQIAAKVDTASGRRTIKLGMVTVSHGATCLVKETSRYLPTRRHILRE